MRKEQIKSIDFIKGICALGVLLFHFECHYTSRTLTFISNYFDGGSLVTVFLIVSGALLWYHNADHLELKSYYIKRWKAIYPMFYLAYVPFWALNVLRHGAVFYNGSPFAYLYSFLAIDGYVSLRTTTYTLVGEWFLGAIIVLYILFPLLRWCFSKNRWLTFVGVAALYVLFYDKPITNASGYWTISSCLVSFCFGMLFMEYRKQIMSLPGILAAAVGYVLVAIVGIPVSANAKYHLEGLCLFILLFAAGEKIMARPRLEPMFRKLSKLSYPVFLVHHVILLVILQIWQPVPMWQIAVLAVLTIAVILVASQVLVMVTKFVMTGFEKIWSKRKTKCVLEK